MSFLDPLIQLSLRFKLGRPLRCSVCKRKSPQLQSKRFEYGMTNGIFCPECHPHIHAGNPYARKNWRYIP